MEQNLVYGKKSYQYIDILYLEMETVELLRIAGEDDKDIIRNSQGVPILPGTSIAGAVQDYLNEQRKQEYKTFWGNDEYDNKVYFFDSCLNDADHMEVLFEERTSHKHDAKRGGTEEGKLLEQRFLKPECHFPVIIKTFTSREEHNAVATFFADVVNGFNQGEILLGSRKNNGCGRLKVNMAKQATFALTNAETLLQYYSFKMENPEEPLYHAFEAPVQKQNSRKMKMKLEASIQDALLIQAKESERNEEGYELITAMKSNGKCIIPASTIKGILRGYCTKILKTLAEDELTKNGEQLLELMFGTDSERMNGQQVRRGIIRVNDTVIENPQYMKYHRIKIDRFTGGTINGAKMTSKPVTKGTVAIHVELNPYNGAEKIESSQLKNAVLLLFFTLRDMGYGKIPMGSFASVGFGRLKNGTVTLDIPEGLVQREKINGRIKLEQKQSYDGNVELFLKNCLKCFRDMYKGGC